MNPKFDLGQITVKPEVAYALEIAGQDADFFLQKHACGDCGAADPAHNEKAISEARMVMSKYRTLRGHELLVVTFLDKGQTMLFCEPGSVVKYVPVPDLGFWKEKPTDAVPE